jgi:cyclase
MRRLIVLGVLVGVGGLSIGVRGYQTQARGPQAPAALTVQKVKDNLFVLIGGGGNTAVFITATGVVVVDAKNPGMGQPILDKIKTLTNRPVTMLINTHMHPDHVSGNVEFPAMIDIVAHDNAKLSMEKMDIFKTSKGKGLPTRTFKSSLTLGSGADQIDLYYFGEGHTSGDVWVVFPALRVAHAADMFPGKNVPFMDAANGGSGVTFPLTLTKAILGLTNIDTIVNGHNGTTTTWSDLAEYRDFVGDFVDWTEREMKAGKSIDAAAAEYKVPDQYKGYTAGTRVKGDIAVIYDELKK